MLLWTEQFATGSASIDEQHRQLIRHLNHFEGLLVETNPTPENLTDIARFLEFLDLKRFLTCFGRRAQLHLMFIQSSQGHRN